MECSFAKTNNGGRKPDNLQTVAALPGREAYVSYAVGNFGMAELWCSKKGAVLDCPTRIARDMYRFGAAQVPALLLELPNRVAYFETGSDNYLHLLVLEQDRAKGFIKWELRVWVNEVGSTSEDINA